MVASGSLPPDVPEETWGRLVDPRRGRELLGGGTWGLAAGAAAVVTEGSELCRAEDTERLFTELDRSG